MQLTDLDREEAVLLQEAKQHLFEIEALLDKAGVDEFNDENELAKLLHMVREYLYS